MAVSVSFIIPVLNGEQFIAHCLDHLRPESRPRDQVIVVDNGSTDRTLEIVRRAGDLTVLEFPGATIAALRNRGAAVATNDVVAFVDADCLVQPGWRRAVERILANPSVSATGSYYDVPEGATWVERAWWSFRPRHEHRTSFLISGNFVVRKKLFDRIGGFDEALITDEDTDISRRLFAAGAIMIEAPSVRVVHLGNAKTLAGFFRKERWHATSIRVRHFDRPMLLTLVFIATCALAASLALFGGGGSQTIVAAVGLIMTAPAMTAAFKVIKHGNYRYFFDLLPLYFLVYLARTVVLMRKPSAQKSRR